MNIDLINRIAATIRRVDGGHTMGAGALAEAIVDDMEQSTDAVLAWVVGDGTSLEGFRGTFLTEDAAEALAEQHPGDTYMSVYLNRSYRLEGDPK